jgi:hypothetical protein
MIRARTVPVAPGSGYHETRAWRSKKQSILRDLEIESSRSPIFKVLDAVDLGPEIRALSVFLIPTLVAPRRGEVRTQGPVVVNLRYHQRWQDVPPLPWEPVTVLFPEDFFHPNAHLGGGLCLGSPPAGIPMEAIIHLTFAALTFQSANPIEWQGLNPAAAGFVRRQADAFPLVPSGLYEAPPDHLLRPLGIPPPASAFLDVLAGEQPPGFGTLQPEVGP